jgi:starch synthase
MRVLYVAGEVAPFSDTTDAARLLRVLPEAVQESGDFEVRIMMPRYGVVSERRNRLHEVIRLSGAEIAVGEKKDTLKVKVASIPGIRLQVYFMDSGVFFKRKGLHRDKRSGEVFPDNAGRALFFGRAALGTARKLGWSPDVVHATGWIAGLVPTLLSGELADDPLFAETKSVYTPDAVDAELVLSPEDAEALGLPAGLSGQTLQQIGVSTANAVAYANPATKSQSGPEGTDLSGEQAEVVERAIALYRSLAQQREMAA